MVEQQSKVVGVALRRGRAGDVVVRIGTTLGHSLPTWWLGLASIVALNTLIGWFPQGPGRAGPLDSLKYVILPACILGLASLVSFTRLVRSEVLENLGQDYVRTARAKGLREAVVMRRHVLRGALLPSITLMGVLLPTVLSGALITEYIFSWPGLGRLALDSALRHDFPVILANWLIISVLVLLGRMLADVLYAVADPRVRLG
jgi:peptide/nickel transport system permease protein